MYKDETLNFVCFWEKKLDFRKKSDFRKKIGISFPPECFLTKLFLKIVNCHGAIVSSSPCICRRNYIYDESIEYRISNQIHVSINIIRNQVSNQHYHPPTSIVISDFCNCVFFAKPLKGRMKKYQKVTRRQMLSASHTGTTHGRRAEKVAILASASSFAGCASPCATRASSALDQRWAFVVVRCVRRVFCACTKLCAELDAWMYTPEGRQTCAERAGPTPDTRGALARHTLGMRCVFVDCGLAHA